MAWELEAMAASDLDGDRVADLIAGNAGTQDLTVVPLGRP
jgi:hypothetical protein